MEQREWLLRATENKVNMGVAYIFKFHKAQCLFCNCMACNILFHGRRQLEKRGTSFIIRLVVHLKALVRRALWMRVVAALLCSLVTSTWMACTIWCSGCAKGGLLQCGDGLGGFGTIPDVLELEAKSNGGYLG